MVITICVLLFSHGKNLEEKTRCYQVFFDGEIIGNVREREVFENALLSVKENIETVNHYEIRIDNNYSFHQSHAKDSKIINSEKIISKINNKINYSIIGYGIEVDGRIIGKLPCKSDAEKLLDEIKKPYFNNKNSRILYIGFAEDVQIKKVEMKKNETNDFDELLKYIQKGTTEEKIYQVRQGDNFWKISDAFNMSVHELTSANPGVDPDLIHPGDRLSLVIPKPFIGVKTKEYSKYEEKLTYDTEYEYVSWLYNDEYRIKKRGEFGIQEVEANIVKENGIEIEKEVIASKILDEPSTQIVYKGTKEPPPKKGTGVFINPLPSGYYSSRFGPRWGGYHYGLDIADGYGTTIKAADGGTVVYAGWYGDYGYMIEIDHGGGFLTRYAHCSKLYVSKGEKVYKGKSIGTVGSTGRSTGPHVHFEVRKYGNPVNPQQYIGVKYR